MSTNWYPVEHQGQRVGWAAHHNTVCAWHPFILDQPEMPDVDGVDGPPVPLKRECDCGGEPIEVVVRDDEHFEEHTPTKACLQCRVLFGPFSDFPDDGW